MEGDNEFQQGDAGSGLTFPKAGGSIRKGDYIMLKHEFPCSVTEISVSKTGKHGHAKARCTGVDIFTGKKYVDVFPTSHNVDVPFVKKLDYEVVDVEIEDNGTGSVSYMDEEGEVHEIIVEDNVDLLNEINECNEKADKEDKSVSISVIMAMGKEQITAWRETK